LLVLTFGSTASGSETDLSDTDLCIVLRTDEDLRSFLGESQSLFEAIGPLVGHYNYSPYHFYAVYRNLIPFDVYCISSSLYFILQASSKQLVRIDHSTRGRVSVSGGNPPKAVVSELLLKAYIRVFRLLSKVQKGDFVTLIYILNSIRDEQVVPLLSLTYGVDIPHAKSIRLDAFPKHVATLFVQTFPNPTRPSCLKALRASSRLLVRIADTLAPRVGLSDLRREILKSEVRIREFR